MERDDVISLSGGPETTVEFALADLRRAARRLARSPDEYDQELASDLNSVYDLIEELFGRIGKENS
jgi:hypothetical protein